MVAQAHDASKLTARLFETHTALERYLGESEFTAAVEAAFCWVDTSAELRGLTAEAWVEPLLGSCCEVLDRHGNRWGISHVTGSHRVTLARLWPGERASVPGVRSTTWPVECAEAVLDAGGSWQARVVWPGLPCRASLRFSGRPKSAVLEVALPQSARPGHSPVEVVAGLRDGQGHLRVDALRLASTRLRVTRDAERTWSKLVAIAGFQGLARRDRAFLWWILQRLARIRRCRRSSTLVEVDRVAQTGSPDPGAWLSALSDGDLLRALAMAVQ